MISTKGKSLWVIQAVVEEAADKYSLERYPDRPTTWRNRGVGVLAETLEGAMRTIRDQFPTCKIISINKHCEQVYIEDLYDAVEAK